MMLERGERYLGSYLVISVLFWVVVFLHVFGHIFMFGLVFVDMWTCDMVLRLA